MIISTCGYGYTGASAVLDFLRGYDEIQIFDTIEFQMLHQADGILDLKYHLVTGKERIACNAAISRFIRLQKSGILAQRIRKKIGHKYDELTDLYISQIINVSWKGKSNYDPLDVGTASNIKLIRSLHRAMNSICRKLKINMHIPPYKTRYFSIMSEEEFDNVTSKYIMALLSELGADFNKDIALDMLFSATNPLSGTEFFDKAKSIIVDRDPRDIFTVSHRLDEEYSFMPWEKVEDFVVYYQRLRKHNVEDSNILRIQYEDLIYDYWNTTQRIMDFLGLKKRPEHEFKYFNPDISVKYTNLNGDNKFSKEMDTIQKELGNSLYNFEKYIPVKDQRR